MTLRHKLLLSQAPLVLALALVAAGALYAALRFSEAPGAILHENFRSFDAVRAMLHAVEGLDQAVLGGEGAAAGAGRADHLARFERELRLQEGNITEVGERDATVELRARWEAYRRGLERPDVAAEGREAHEARSRALRSAAEHVLALNRAAMRAKSAEARLEARRVGLWLTGSALLAFIMAVVGSGLWLRRILAPVRVLEQAVQRLADGDFDAKIRVEGADEIAALSTAFNEMAERLAQYRRSTVGELLDVNARLGSIMDSLADAVLVLAQDGTPVASNAVARRLLGGPALDLRTLPEALQEAVEDAFQRVRSTNEPYEPAGLDAAVEVPGSPAPGWLLVAATPVRTGGDVLSGVTVAIRDVTRSRRIEGFKGDLVAAAAHELRTPLTSLHMAVHLCLEGAAGPLTERLQDLLTTARQDCERLEAVVEELLDMARLEAGAARLEPSVVNLQELVRDTYARHEAHVRSRGKALEVQPGDALLCVHADRARLQRVLDNLVENALVHGGEGGRVALGFERREAEARVFVDDQGPGVPAELRARVFNKFFRVPGTTKRGSGLGLSIVEDIVRAHGGAVGVEDSPLGGARFWFSIPLDQAEGSDAPRSAS